MKRRVLSICDCPTCRALDRAHPNEGRQIAMFAAASPRKGQSASMKGAR